MRKKVSLFGAVLALSAMLAVPVFAADTEWHYIPGGNGAKCYNTTYIPRHGAVTSTYVSTHTYSDGRTCTVTHYRYNHIKECASCHGTIGTYIEECKEQHSICGTFSRDGL